MSSPHILNYEWWQRKEKTDKGGKGEGKKRVESQFNHTNTTGSHISGHHDWALARLELVQDPVSFLLLFVTVDSCVQ